jgi:putative PIN family toxin of toxin-antitoxin system
MAIKIVVDTNVLVSALISPKGASREVVRRCLLKVYQPLIGTNLFCEYEALINRPEILQKCPLTQDEILMLMQAFVSVSQWTSIYYLWRPNLKDEADNHLIELAVAGNAKFVVTYNIRDLQDTELLFPNLSIVQPIDLIQQQNYGNTNDSIT